jgi:5-methyltetrahydrofolate--homocysteine methyltransferase
MSANEKFYKALSEGEVGEVKRLIQEALDAGDPPEVVLKGGLIHAMDRIGARFKNSEIYIPEVLVAARAMHAGLAVLKPLLSQSAGAIMGKVVIGTVKGDLHDIGKNLVGTMLEGGGFEVVDLGINVPPDTFMEAIKKHQPQVLAMSALLTTTMIEMEKVLQSLESAGLRKQVKTIIGGAPVSEGFRREIGADGYAPDAATAVEVVRSLI